MVPIFLSTSSGPLKFLISKKFSYGNAYMVVFPLGTACTEYSRKSTPSVLFATRNANRQITSSPLARPLVASGKISRMHFNFPAESITPWFWNQHKDILQIVTWTS
ncbi:hypothetical protein CKAN_01298300 [Cinnamomum micranthum f. kanehirae]|uniref:Uncharacterized protein n=1 Tax=Cinnamomum micranthum f. kanehirae TaxID=337451 RepID=A0A443P0D3_9MAGN|nr:hypothetical protein CKAN_01298300 [Cinnamomum micranthum f. kanehirae]